MSVVREINSLLCFDFGMKRIGVAVGQTITRTSSPLTTIKNKNNHPDWDAIQQLIEAWQPDALIVGIPFSAVEDTHKIAAAAQKFMRQLQGRWSLLVYGVDEHLSSFEASQRCGKKDDLDPVAAQVILETWFADNDNYNNNHAVS